MISDSFTENSNKVVKLAEEEARFLGHNFIGTEQLLSALVAEQNGIAGRAIRAFGITHEDIRNQVEKLIGKGSGFVAKNIPFTPRANRVLELAAQEAKSRNTDYVDTEHILLGILREGNGVAVCILENLGIKLKLVEQLEGNSNDEEWEIRKLAGDIVAQKPDKEIEIPEWLKKDTQKNIKPDKNTNFIDSFFKKLRLKFRPEEDGISKKI